MNAVNASSDFLIKMFYMRGIRVLVRSTGVAFVSHFK